MIEMDVHFIDSNIFLSIVTKDNAKHICEEYFKSSSVKVTSGTVETESNEVISKLEKISLAVISCIGEYVSINKIPDEKIGISLITVKKIFLNKHSHEEYPFGIDKKKFVKMVNSLFSYYGEVLKYSMEFSFENWVSVEYSAVRSDYKNYYLNLQILLNKVKLYHYTVNFNDFYSRSTQRKYAFVDKSTNFLNFFFC